MDSDFTTCDVKTPSTDQLFNDAWWWAKDKNAQPLPTTAMLNSWIGKLNEIAVKRPVNHHDLFDVVGTCMIGLIAVAESYGIDPNSALYYAMQQDKFKVEQAPKSLGRLDRMAPELKEEPDWLKKLHHELTVRFVGQFVYYPDEQEWVRLERVEIDLRNSPEGRGMDRVKDYYGNMHFVTDLMEMEKNYHIKAYYECPKERLVY